MRVEVAVTVAAPRAVVWDVLTDWEAQADWMRDARSVEVVSAERAGEGVTIRVPTNLLGVTVDDVMRVTGWDPPARLEVAHLGRLIRGSGAFELYDIEHGTRVVWWEEIEPPLGALGRWGARTVVRPLVERVFRRSLRGLREASEVAAARAASTP